MYNKGFEPGNNLERAVLMYLIKEIDRNYWNNNQKELEDSPFENTGAKLVIICEDARIEAKAYDWENEESGYLKFWLMGELKYEYQWYKQCMRGLKVNRHDMEQGEFLDIILEHLESSWIKSEEDIAEDILRIETERENVWSRRL